MKKIVIISDTHGNAKGIEKLMPIIQENDYVIHLGDGAGDMRAVWDAYPDKVFICAGNCDFFSPWQTEGELEVEGVKIFYCHGHQYDVKRTRLSLARETKSRGCQIALYGHTHVAKISEREGVTLINPGSLRRSVNEGGSYCYLVINKDKFTPVIVGEQYF